MPQGTVTTNLLSCSLFRTVILKPCTWFWVCYIASFLIFRLTIKPWYIILISSNLWASLWHPIHGVTWQRGGAFLVSYDAINLMQMAVVIAGINMVVPIAQNAHYYSNSRSNNPLGLKFLQITVDLKSCSSSSNGAIFSFNPFISCDAISWCRSLVTCHNNASPGEFWRYAGPYQRALNSSTSTPNITADINIEIQHKTYLCTYSMVLVCVSICSYIHRIILFHI